MESLNNQDNCRKLLYQIWQKLPPADACPVISEAVWQEIVDLHTAPGRHYHSLTHLCSIYENLQSASHLINRFDSLLYAMFFHDFIYDPQRRDNEERSAAAAEQKMQQLGIEPELAELTRTHIVATRADSLIQMEDSGYFVDADLAVLGSPPQEYAAYAAQVRQEYQRFPDFLYNPGRRNVLRHFLKKKYIYHSTFFRKRYEQQARQNITEELNRL